MKIIIVELLGPNKDTKELFKFEAHPYKVFKIILRSYQYYIKSTSADWVLKVDLIRTVHADKAILNTIQVPDRVISRALELARSLIEFEQLGEKD